MTVVTVPIVITVTTVMNVTNIITVSTVKTFATFTTVMTSGNLQVQATLAMEEVELQENGDKAKVAKVI